MRDLSVIADAADMIINGYAFTKCRLGYKVLNLNRPNNALVISNNGDVLETTMDDIEISVVSDYFINNRELMED